ncbi:MAG: peptide chain release factor 2 [Acidobacteria bacterium]|nr:MAG: peptide chain release factor 2 [Acidobacteriota bacterium]
MLEDCRSHHDKLTQRVDELRRFFDRAATETSLARLDVDMGRPGFWDDAEKAREVTRRRQTLTNRLDSVRGLDELADDAQALRELWDEGEDAEEDFRSVLTRLDTAVQDLEISTLLSGEEDGSNAIFTLHAGAGGTESMDWAQMLLRMYLRYFERKGYKVSILDEQAGEEAGIKGATLEVQGPMAYGYLKVEEGVHRLVRISPFDAAARRHTSFASVAVVPEVADEVEIEIDDKDLRIDTYRSSGAGGQHVNVTDSAVRITHMPSGIVVSCQNERSQHKNKAMAMKVLRSRLADKARAELDAERQAREDEKKEIAFGNQIRSYVLHPYRMVKDHRTNLEIGDVDRVLDGDLDRLIHAELKNRRQHSASEVALPPSTPGTRGDS